MVPGVTWLLRQVGALCQFNRFAWKCRTACNAEELAHGGEIEKAFIFARSLLVTIHCFWEKTVFSWFGWWTVSTALNLANTVKHVLVTVKDVSFPYRFSSSLSERKGGLFFPVVETGLPRFWKVSNFSVCVWFHKENLLVGSQIHWYWAANARFIFVAQFGTGVNCGESYHDIKGTVPVDGQRNFIAFREPWFTWRSTGHECRIIKQEYKKTEKKRQEIAAVACSSSKEAMVFSILE